MTNPKGIFLAALAACLAMAAPVKAAQLKSFAGGAIFPGEAGVQVYFAQMAASKKPLLKAYGFMATEHFFVLLRQQGSSGGSLEYQVYADGGVVRKGSGSFTMAGKGLRAAGSQGFRLKITVKGDQIQIQYQGVNGKYRTAGTLQKF